MILKCGRREFKVDHTDEILDNGHCYLLISQTYHYQYSNLHPYVAKTTFKRLLKEGKIYKARPHKPSNYVGKTEMWIYKFKE